jgi:threonine dehydrogenase-like Zn-dependent dehydrogenase
VRLQLTHLLAYELDGSEAGERDAVALGPPAAEGAERRYFVPGRLPCGSCALCRRGLVAACAAAVIAVPGEAAGRDSALEVPERFLTPLDEPAPARPLPSQLAAGAGLVALAIQASAAANLTAGDVAIWLGGGVLADVGAQLTAGRGARTLVLGGPGPARPAIEALPSPSDLLAHLQAEPLADAAEHQCSTRRVFLTRTEGPVLRAASLLADAGASLVTIGRGVARPGPELLLPPEIRVTRISGYHPDLVPEALALLASTEVQVPPGWALGGA